MRGYDLVKAWNECRGTNFSKGTEEKPSTLAFGIDSYINVFGEKLVTDYITDAMLDENGSTDLYKLVNYHCIASYQKRIEEEQKQKDFNRDSSVISVLGQELVKQTRQKI